LSAIFISFFYASLYTNSMFHSFFIILFGHYPILPSTSEDVTYADDRASYTVRYSEIATTLARG